MICLYLQQGFINFKWGVYVIGHCFTVRVAIRYSRHNCLLGYGGKLTFMNREWLLSAVAEQNYIRKVFYNLR